VPLMPFMASRWRCAQFCMCFCTCRRKPIGVTLVGGASLPWIVGALCSLLASVDYDNLVDLDVCRQSVVYVRRRETDDARTISWTSALAVSYWVVVVLVGVWLGVAYFCQRRKYASTLLRRDPAAMSHDRSGLSRDDGRRRTSCISGAGSSSPDVAVGDAAPAEMSRRESSGSSKKKRLSRKQSGERTSKSSEVCRSICVCHC